MSASNDLIILYLTEWLGQTRANMNSLDIILYLLGAGALFALFLAGYATGHNDGQREGYARGRSVSRVMSDYK